MPKDVFEFYHIFVCQWLKLVYLLNDRQAPVLLQEVYDLLPVGSELDANIHGIARRDRIANVNKYNIFALATRILHDVAQLPPPHLDRLQRRFPPEQFINKRLDLFALRLHIRYGVFRHKDLRHRDDSLHVLHDLLREPAAHQNRQLNTKHPQIIHLRTDVIAFPAIDKRSNIAIDLSHLHLGHALPRFGGNVAIYMRHYLPHLNAAGVRIVFQSQNLRKQLPLQRCVIVLVKLHLAVLRLLEFDENPNSRGKRLLRNGKGLLHLDLVLLLPEKLEIVAVVEDAEFRLVLARRKHVLARPRAAPNHLYELDA